MWKIIELLITPKSGYSSKRLISLLSFIALILTLVLSWLGVMSSDIYIQSLVILILGNSAVGLFDKKGEKDGNN